MSKKSKPSQILGELDKTKLFQKMISEAIQYGFDVLIETSFDFSPVDIVLNAAIDLILLLRRMFELGSASQSPNQGLGFSETEQDVLGNPKQFRISSPRKYFWDPNADEYFTQLAQCFIEIKNSKPVKTSFHEMFDFLDLGSSNKRGYNRKAKNRYFYWRRRKRRINRHDRIKNL